MNKGQDWNGQIFCAAEEALGYRFTNRELLLTAFTHASYANVNGGRDNERLEHLGDAVLELCVTEKLYCDEGMDEGAMTVARQNLVSEPALTASAEALGVLQYLRHVGGESNLAGKTASNLFEAITGAIYLDGGLEAARKFLDSHLLQSERNNYRSLLQEYVQERCKTTPVYKDEGMQDGQFVSCVLAMGQSAKGYGTSKKIAQTNAAKALYDILKKEVSDEL